MAFVFNIAKGRVAELYNRVKTADPASATLLIVPVHRGSTSNSTLRDKETLSDLLAVVTERTTGGWSRLPLVSADIAALTADHLNDKVVLGIGQQTWPGVLVSAGAITDLVLCYSTGSDATAVPLTMQAYPITPDGRGVTLTASDFFEVN